MAVVYDNWERLVQATLRREELRISGLRTPSDLSWASSSSSFSFSFNFSCSPQLSSFKFSGLLVGDSFSYHQILQATDYLSSSNLIKHGCSGDLFYGVLEGGKQVVIKKVDLSSVEKESYLRNVEASSILLDENCEVRLGGLHEVCFEKITRNRSSISKLLRLPKGSEKGTSGASDETCAYDVCCFGKVFLQLITGKKIIRADYDSSVRDWISSSLPYITPYNKELCVNILDATLFMDTIIKPVLIRDEHLLFEVWAVAVVAKACLSPEPSKRPQMAYILEALQDPKSVRFSAHGSPQFGAVGPALVKTRVPKGYKQGTSVATTKATFSGSSTASLNHQFSATALDDVAYLNKETRDLSDFRIYSFTELKSATRYFSTDGILGKGGFGKVYKGWIDEKSTSKSGSRSLIAVKRLELDRTQEFHEWQYAIHKLGRFSHPNFVKLLGYCWEDKEHILVYEFMKKGSLDNHLYGRPSHIQPLPWDIRLKILIGAARGLAFLHEDERVIYRDFKTANILLDGSYNAKISIFGLPMLRPLDRATLVYAAPEYVATGCLTSKSDAYGFGFVVAEVLTGLKAPDYHRLSGQQNLVDWIKPHLSDKRNIRSILDTKLQAQYPIKAVVQMAKLALTCLSCDSKSRPNMKEVVDALENIKSANEKPRGPRTNLTH